MVAHKWCIDCKNMLEPICFNWFYCKHCDKKIHYNNTLKDDTYRWLSNMNGYNHYYFIETDSNGKAIAVKRNNITIGVWKDSNKDLFKLQCQ